MLIPRNVRLLSVTRAYYTLPPATLARPAARTSSSRVFLACLERCFCGRRQWSALTCNCRAAQMRQAYRRRRPTKMAAVRQETCGRYRGSGSCAGPLHRPRPAQAAEEEEGRREKTTKKGGKKLEIIFIHALYTRRRLIGYVWRLWDESGRD